MKLIRLILLVLIFWGSNGTTFSQIHLSEIIRKAEQGDSKSQINLGILYSIGVGVEKDLTKAKKMVSTSC